MILPVIAGAVVGAALRFAVRAGVQYAGRQLSRRALRRLLDRAKQYGDDVLQREISRRKACRTCRQLDDLADPCQFLRSGTGTGPYNGGSYNGTRSPGIESHHVPAQSAYPPGSMSPGVMPAIAMDPADHRQTASYGSGADARAYQTQQRMALQRGGLAAAFAMDVADIKLRFGDKYDQAIMEASAYLACISKYPDKYPTGQRQRRGRRP
ncbi:MAG: hypothetical protein MUE98_16740 [Rhodobacteraceae bacterium]|jgi:hypothetical protein|nr:hypothetical protein [Paracoccaceae bacterium]